jgi:hypothetical protein
MSMIFRIFHYEGHPTMAKAYMYEGRKYPHGAEKDAYEYNPEAVKELARLHREHGTIQCKNCGKAVPYKQWKTNNGLCSLCKE